jgi:hypothetical protein
LRIRLLLAYESSNGALRTARLALDVPVLPSLTSGPVSVKPVPGTLAALQAQFPVTPAQAAEQWRGTLDVHHAVLQSQYWAFHGGAITGAASRAAGTALPESCDMVQLQQPVQIEGHWRREVAVALEPRAATASDSRQSDGVGASPEKVEAQLDDCTLLLPWRYQDAPGQPVRVGVFTAPRIQMSSLIAGSALRMTATLPDASASATHPYTLAPAHGGPDSETHAAVRIRVRNCGARSISLCLECGELGGRALPHARPLSAGAPGTPRERGLLVLAARSQHQWLGGARRHVLDLPAQAEQECTAQLALTGAGAFSVDGILCTWNVPEANILGRVLQGDRLEVFVDPEA